MNKTAKQFLLYALRWESSTLILAPCVSLLSGLGVLPATIIANFLGACIFFVVDRRIFKR